MKLVRFLQDDGEVLIDLENISHITRETASKEYIEEVRGKIKIDVILKKATKDLVFFGKDAEKVWDYFSMYGPPIDLRKLDND